LELNEIGKVEEELVYEKVSGDPLEISFNPDYMKDALRDQFFFYFTDFR
jgi:DNA polymerase III sliding clamp (beta) subunit (PCNA family)